MKNLFVSSEGRRIGQELPAVTSASRGSYDRPMLEKYLHSQGAAHYDGGLLDEAISWFEKAISIDEKPYTRYHLALALQQKGDLARATVEIGRAIELNPAVPEYYYQRSLIWKAAGDNARSEEDMARAAALDASYRRRDIIRSAIKAAHRVFYGAGIQALPDTQSIANGDLRRIVRTAEKTGRILRETVELASCALNCPAYCCHFSEAPFLHGIYIGPWKLRAIRAHLRERALSEKVFLDRVPFKREVHFTRLLPPHIVVREDGREFVYAPKRRKAVLRKSLLRSLPKGQDYQSLMWITEKARPCMFLNRGRCMIHDLAGEPGLPSCKEFLCLTGFVMVVLKHLGMVEQRELEKRSLNDLNGISVEALVILHDWLYGNEKLTALAKAMEDALRRALEADRWGDPGETDNCLGVYRHVKATYYRLFRLQKERAGREIRNLFGYE